MDRSATHALIERLVHRVTTDSMDEAESPLEEVTADFLDPARFERERRQFFVDAPQVIGFAGEVREPGSFVTADVVGVPIVVARGRDGSLRAFVNACGHRGARVAVGQGSALRLTCRFHGWTYGLDGRLAGRRQADSFDPPDPACDLVELPVSDRSGLLVVGVHPGVSQGAVEQHLAAVEDQFAGFGFDRMQALETRRFEVAANWKLVTAASCESYHFATLHRDTVAQWLTHHFVTDTFDERHVRWAFPMVGIEALAGRPRDEWPDRLPGAINHLLFPGTVVITDPENAQIIRAEPGPTVGTSIVHYHGGFLDPGRREQAQASYDFGGHAFEHEDLPAVVECQRGLDAGRTRLLAGRNEPVVQFWFRRWREALADGDEGVAGASPVDGR